MRGSETRVLQALEEEQTISELAEHLDLSKGYVFELVSDPTTGLHPQGRQKQTGEIL
jgi:hypothetical protein